MLVLSVYDGAMLLLVPIFGLICCLTAILLSQKRTSIGFACVKTYIIGFCYVAVSTEILSWLRIVEVFPVLACWCAFSVVAVIAVVVKLRDHQDRRSIGLRCYIRATGKFIWTEKWHVICVAAVAIPVLISGLVYPPNTWDSMTYHMSRVMHWCASHCVDFYPTSITRQNYQPPLSEFGLMHIYLLSGTDALCNLLQWSAYMMLPVVVYLLARALRFRKHVAAASAMLCLFMPMAILQASSTKNDVIAAFFISSFMLFSLRASDRISGEDVVYAGLSLGLAVLTKGTSQIFCLPIAVMAAVRICMRNKKSIRSFVNAARSIIITACLAAILCAGHFIRTWQHYGNLFPAESSQYQVSGKNLSTLVSNSLRNLTLHTASPFPLFNWYQFRLIDRMLGESAQSEVSTWSSTTFAVQYYIHENFSGNIFHLLLIVPSVLMALLLFKSGMRNVYAMTIIAGALLFCWLLKWQPWGSRLHTPLFVLAMPLVGVIFSPLSARLRALLIRIVVPISFSGYAIIFALYGFPRFLLPIGVVPPEREARYFKERSDLYKPYSAAIEYLTHLQAHEVGLVLGENDFEYPFWALSRSLAPPGGAMTFRHVFCDSAENAFDKGSLPDFILSTVPFDAVAMSPQYKPAFEQHGVAIYAKVVGSGGGGGPSSAK